MTDSQRRKNPRYAFVASAELIETRSDTRVATRVSELSLHGCYLDMLNPFPVNTLVRVKISSGDAAFQSQARVVYAHANFGAGMTFLNVEPEYMAVLQKWLEDAGKDPDRLIG